MTAAREVTVIERRTVTVLLDDAEPMTAAYQSTPRRFRPARLTAEWIRRDGGEWELTSATARGPMIKKSGQDSALFGERHLGSYRSWREDAPTWARALVEAYAPEGGTR